MEIRKSDRNRNAFCQMVKIQQRTQSRLDTIQNNGKQLDGLFHMDEKSNYLCDNECTLW